MILLAGSPAFADPQTPPDNSPRLAGSIQPTSPRSMGQPSGQRNNQGDNNRNDNHRDDNHRDDNRRDDHRDNHQDTRQDNRRDEGRNNGRDRNDHRRPPNVVVHIDAGSPGYYRPAPRYIPAPVNYHHRYYREYPYYYSSYYTQRPIPVEASSPYVEVQCGAQPITGTIVGGLAGGLLGNQFGRGDGRTVATVTGALLGAIIGQGIDRQDESCAYQALEYAQPNTQVGWVNPDDNYAYTVTPGPVTQSEDGRYCREYQAKILVGTTMQDGYGRACRQSDGSWEVVN